MTMSVYNGRRAPNVSEYINSLNTIQPLDVPGQDEEFSLTNDLDIFTNAEFFDFGMDVNQHSEAEVNRPHSGSYNNSSETFAQCESHTQCNVMLDVPTGS